MSAVMGIARADAPAPADAVAPADAEARRQRALVDAIRGGGPGALAGWPLAAPRAGAERGLAVYRANAAAHAERALAAACPTVAALVGDEAMAGLARALLRGAPPDGGDLGAWGGALAALIDAEPAFAEPPYLADCARLDWLLHLAGRAADAPAGVAGLDRLADTDPAALRLVLRPGSALLRSRWPVATILAAHAAPADAPDRFEPARRALDAGQGEAVFVWRDGWRPRARALAPPQADFTEALLAGRPLAVALDAAGAALDFGAWLADAVRGGALASVQPITDPEGALP